MVPGLPDAPGSFIGSALSPVARRGFAEAPLWNLWELAGICKLRDCCEGTQLSTVSFLVGELVACCSGTRSVTP